MTEPINSPAISIASADVCTGASSHFQGTAAMNAATNAPKSRAITRTVSLESRLITVRELTTAEVRHWLESTAAGAPVDAVQEMVFEGVSLADLARMSDISAADLEAYAPSDLAELLAVCREVNPHFFRVRKALMGLVERVAAIGTVGNHG